MKQRGGGTIRLDRLDLKILATLQTAGRISNLELADTVGLSATPCQQRVRRMEAAGYISGYGAQLAIDRICRNIVVFTEITLSNHRREDFLKFERGIQEIPQLLNCFLVTGGYDYLAQFIAQDIHDDLGQHVTGLRLKLEWLAGEKSAARDDADFFQGFQAVAYKCRAHHQHFLHAFFW